MMSRIRALRVWFAAKVAVVVLGAAVFGLSGALPALADGVTSAEPNGRQFRAGINAVVVQADRQVTPAEVVAAIEGAAPGFRALDLWVLARGQWLNYHPSAAGSTQLGTLGRITAVYVTLAPR